MDNIHCNPQVQPESARKKKQELFKHISSMVIKKRIDMKPKKGCYGIYQTHFLYSCFGTYVLILTKVSSYTLRLWCLQVVVLQLGCQVFVV